MKLSFTFIEALAEVSKNSIPFCFAYSLAWWVDTARSL